jgi:hypothetical protein
VLNESDDENLLSKIGFSISSFVSTIAFGNRKVSLK